MSGPCLGHVWVMFGPCLGYVWTMFGPCLGHVWAMFGPCLGHVWTMFGPRGLTYMCWCIVGNSYYWDTAIYRYTRADMYDVLCVFRWSQLRLFHLGAPFEAGQFVCVAPAADSWVRCLPGLCICVGDSTSSVTRHRRRLQSTHFDFVLKHSKIYEQMHPSFLICRMKISGI
jgi:hypothetical protein